jgi:hypothetical protein
LQRQRRVAIPKSLTRIRIRDVSNNKVNPPVAIYLQSELQKKRGGSANSHDDDYDHNNMESVQGDEGQHFTAKDPNISPSDPEGRMSIGYSE